MCFYWRNNVADTWLNVPQIPSPSSVEILYVLPETKLNESASTKHRGGRTFRPFHKRREQLKKEKGMHLSSCVRFSFFRAFALSLSSLEWPFSEAVSKESCKEKQRTIMRRDKSIFSQREWQKSLKVWADGDTSQHASLGGGGSTPTTTTLKWLQAIPA